MIGIEKNQNKFLFWKVKIYYSFFSVANFGLLLPTGQNQVDFGSSLKKTAQAEDSLF